MRVVSARIYLLIIIELSPYRVPEHFAVVSHAPEADVKNSHLPIPTGSGIGVELDRDRVASFLWAECRL